MSAQFGKCNFDGKPVDPKDLDEVRPVLAPYGPDGEGCLCKDSAGILYRAFHTTKESRREIQPHISRSGLILTWDGRLDNREELIREMSSDMLSECTDVEIAAAAYRRWGTKAFAKLIGDWALSIYDPNDPSLVLAKDFVGTRQLYYTVEKDCATWCSILDPLVLFAGHQFELEQEYVAGWLAFFPAPHLTPYVGIRSVPPSSFVRLAMKTLRVVKYWDFDPANKIRYRTDAEYEEHFRVAFSESVRRRLRSDTPVLAELSGGMDSSSIVCVADGVIAQKRAETIRLDTVSYYDDTEPNWNERPYFTKVEAGRGRAGWHIDVSSQKFFNVRVEENTFVAVPNSCGAPKETKQQFSACVASQGSRVLLSGIGGDEVAGGVPTPMPELEDLLARFRLQVVANRLKEWALCQRKPWIHLIVEAAGAFLPPALISIPAYKRPASWLHPDFVMRHKAALRGYESRLKLFGPLPSFQENILTLDMLRRQLSCDAVPSDPLYEKRYPYLDRSLLEFIYAIPREQIVRPAQRRSLMRRALAGIVPDEVLNRRRKAFVARSPIVAISMELASLRELSERLVSSALGFVDARAFAQELEKARRGQEIPVVTLKRTLCLELWLRAAASALILPSCQSNASRDFADTRELSAPLGQSGSRRVQLAVQANPTGERR
jgi:asparagine synthase (glutamine-hydrolysing)